MAELLLLLCEYCMVALMKDDPRMLVAGESSFVEAVGSCC